MDLSQNKIHTVAFGGTVLLLSLLGTYLYQRRKKEKIPEEWEPVGTVTQLALFPLKSGGKKPVKVLECTKVGPKQTEEDGKEYQMRDRELLIFGDDDTLRTIRTHPVIATIDVNVHDKDHFSFDAPNMKTLYVKIPKAGEEKIRFVKCSYKEMIRTMDCGDEPAYWVSKYILGEDKGLRLGYFEGEFTRDLRKTHEKYLKFYKNIKNEYSGLYSDMSAVHIINENSVKDLNSRIETTNVGIDNFRPNIVVNGDNYAEENWDFIKIGQAIFRQIKPCTRCILTTVNPANGIKDPQGEPLKTLRSYNAIKNKELRKLENYSPVMGIYAGVIKTGRVRLGDVVYAGK